MSNAEKIKDIIGKYGFDFNSISKQEITSLLEKELDNYLPGNFEYVRLLCGYIYCIGNASDIPLLKRAKYTTHEELTCMIDAEWIYSLINDSENITIYGSRNQIMENFVTYYKNFYQSLRPT